MLHNELTYSPQQSTPGGQPSRDSGTRLPELDGIRGIAILSVLLYHLFSYSMYHRGWSGFARIVASISEKGSHGVDLFFVLSGFLITGILLDSRLEAHYFRNFYARRALRILPLYYTVLLAILFCYPHSGQYVLLSFFHLSNISPILGITMVNGALWSLSVEEHFYLCWPWIVRRLNLRNVALVAALVCAIEPAVRGIAFPYVSTVFPYTWFRLDGIASGALIACFFRSSIYSRDLANRAAVLLGCLGLLMEIESPWSIRQHQTRFGAIFEYPPIDMICAAVVLWGASNSRLFPTRALRFRPLRIAGDLSYCLYLNHMMVMDVYDGVLRALGYAPAVGSFRGILIRTPFVLVASFLIATISRVVLEQPALRARRFFPARMLPERLSSRAAFG